MTHVGLFFPISETRRPGLNEFCHLASWCLWIHGLFTWIPWPESPGVPLSVCLPWAGPPPGLYHSEPLVTGFWLGLALGGNGRRLEGCGLMGREPSFFSSSLFGVVSPAVATTRTPASGPSYMALTVTGFWSHSSPEVPSAPQAWPDPGTLPVPLAPPPLI